MTVTQPIIALIAKRFRDSSKPKLNQSQIAESMGLSKAWASKLMTGKIKRLTDEQARQLEGLLDIRLLPYIQEVGGPTSELASQLTRHMQNSEPMSRIVSALLELQDPKAITGPKWIETQDMTKIGQEIIRIAFANEDKPGKVARMVLELLA